MFSRNGVSFAIVRLTMSWLFARSEQHPPGLQYVRTYVDFNKKTFIHEKSHDIRTRLLERNALVTQPLFLFYICLYEVYTRQFERNAPDSLTNNLSS